MRSLLVSGEAFAQQLAVQQEQESRLNEQMEQLAQRQAEMQDHIKQLDLDIARYE